MYFKSVPTIEDQKKKKNKEAQICKIGGTHSGEGFAGVGDKHTGLANR